MDKRIKINLGCGNDYKKGFVNVDKNKNIKADIYCDIFNYISILENNSVNYIFASHCLEHLSDVESIMYNLHRILEDKGRLEIIVPDFSTKYGLIDPTHKSIWADKTIDYWCGKNKILKYFNFNFVKIKQLVYGYDTEHLNIHWLLKKDVGDDCKYSNINRTNTLKFMQERYFNESY